ncbi:MAG: hypothetical protein SGBAC_004888 [Bacillariaceae sp.]
MLSFRRALYESNPLGETELSDVWLCLACALGWSVWLLSSKKQAKVEPSIFDRKESIKVTGNVLEVTLGEDADGTGIPVYLALIDYVVECYDPDDDTAKFIPQAQQNHPSSPPREGKSSTEKFKKGVVLEPTSPAYTDKHLQIRKCFYTNKLLEVGFANVKVLCLLEDPTTSELWDEYLHDKRQRKKPQNWMQLYMVYCVAVVLIIASLYGGYQTVEHLPPELTESGYISLGIGALLLYPISLLFYNSYCFVHTWFSTRKGRIIRGNERWHCTRMSCGMHPIMEEDDEAASSLKSRSSMTHKHRNHLENVKSLEMPELHEASSIEYAPPKPRTFREAGCGMNEYNVQTLTSNPSTVSSISSTGKSVTTPANNGAVCQDATSQFMEAFESMSAFGTKTSTDMELKPSKSSKTTMSETLKKLGNFRRISSDGKVAARTSYEGDELNAEFDRSADEPMEDEVQKIYSA